MLSTIHTRHLKGAAGGRDDGAFNHVLKLAYVAWPLMTPERLDDRLGNLFDVPAMTLKKLRTKCLTRSGMSSMRSRSGGTRIGNTFNR